MLDIVRRITRRRNRTGIPLVEGIELRHVQGQVADLVRHRLVEGEPPGTRDGDRSIRLLHPEKSGFEIKIKGAGDRGGPVRFGTRHRTGPVAPLFDFEGRMMEDTASGHDNAYEGGASFQQAATEYAMAGLLAARGYRPVPCLGYGRIWHGGFESWFSVHEYDSSWHTISPANVSLAEYVRAKTEMGRLTLELAIRHGLCGYSTAVGAPGQPYVLKDLHPFRAVDPLSMSQVSWVMQLFFALHIQALSAIHFVCRHLPGTNPTDAQVAVFRAVHPGVTAREHEALRRQLVAPYMLRPRRDFDPLALRQVLVGSPITRALLDACPPEYARL